MTRLLALATCLSAAAAFAGTTLVYELKTKDKVRLVTIGVEAKKLYVETKVGDAVENTVVRDGVAKLTTIAMHSKKEVMEMSDEDAAKMKEKMVALREQMQVRMKAQLEKMPADQRAKMEAMMGDPSAAAKLTKATYEKKGGSQTIAGYPCDNYSVKHDGKVDGEACFTPNAKLGGVAEELKAQMKEMMSGFAFAPQTTGNDFDWTEGAPGFPVLYRRLDEQGQMKSENTLKSIAKGSIAPAKFVTPADYKRIVPPALGGVAGPGAVPKGSEAPAPKP